MIAHKIKMQTPWPVGLCPVCYAHLSILSLATLSSGSVISSVFLLLHATSTHLYLAPTFICPVNLSLRSQLMCHFQGEFSLIEPSTQPNKINSTRYMCSNNSTLPICRVLQICNCCSKSSKDHKLPEAKSVLLIFNTDFSLYDVNYVHLFILQTCFLGTIVY